MAVASVPPPLAADLAGQVRDYLQRHVAVALWEDGRKVARLEGERAGYALHPEGARLVCHFWTQDANLVRRVSAAEPAAGGRLRLTAWRLGQAKPGVLLLAPEGAEAAPSERAREEFRLALRAAVERTWRGWTPVACAAGGAARGGIERLVIQRQHASAVVVGVGEEESLATATAALAQGLILAAAAPPPVVAIRLVVPEAAMGVLAERRTGLRASPPIELYRWDRAAGELEPWTGDGGAANLSAALCRALPRGEGEPPPEAAALLEDARRLCPQAEWDAEGGRMLVYGLEVARRAGAAEALAATFTFGCGGERTPLVEATRPDFERLLAAVGRQRVPGGDRRQPYYTARPEAWLEHLLRRDPGRLDARLDPRFLYSQVATADLARRDILDLVGVDREGRLVVVELKADEALEFPLQGLDYWLRVRRHQAAGDFERLGYFPGVRLSPLPPRLWLAGPALHWHPKSEPLYRALAPEIAWARIGLNEAWRRGVQVVFRREAGAVL